MAVVTEAVAASLEFSDSLVVQGGMLRLDVRSAEPPDTVTGTFAGKDLPFIRDSAGFYSLIGVDMEMKPGRYNARADVQRGKSRQRLTVSLRVRDARFPVQKVTLPPAKVFPDSAATARIGQEDSLRNRRWVHWETVRYWHGSFIAPLKGEMNRFGSRRIINGAPRSPHTGVDISADAGVPVVAPSGGRVILIGDYFFTGNSIYIDHGYGLISMFFHLSRVDVAEGDLVEQGQVIGEVGATGRVTGPHLHWGVRYRGARVNPEALLELKLD